MSVFGMAHLFERNRIIKEYAKKYSRVQEDIAKPKDDLAALIHDHLLDLSPFIEEPLNET